MTPKRKTPKTPKGTKTPKTAKNSRARVAPDSLRKPLAAARPDEMAEDVLEFITAIDEYKRKHEKPFPTWSEVFEIFRDLGYERAG